MRPRYKKQDDDAAFKAGLRKYCDDLLSILNKSNEHFEKQISYISAGSLGLSFLLIEKVLGDIWATKDKWLLITGWSLLALTLISNLISHQLAMSFHYKSIGEIEGYLCGENEYNEIKIALRNRKIKAVNVFSIIFLSLGIVSIITYTSINITMSEDIKKGGNQEKSKPQEPKPLNDRSHQLPDRGSYENANNKSKDIIDKGHTGIPPKKPGKK